MRVLVCSSGRHSSLPECCDGPSRVYAWAINCSDKTSSLSEAACGRSGLRKCAHRCRAPDRLYDRRFRNSDARDCRRTWSRGLPGSENKINDVEADRCAVSPTIRTILIESGPTAGAMRMAVVAALRPHLPEAIRRKAEMWLACEVTSWRAQFQPKMTWPPEFRLK